MVVIEEVEVFLGMPLWCLKPGAFSDGGLTLGKFGMSLSVRTRGGLDDEGHLCTFSALFCPPFFSCLAVM